MYSIYTYEHILYLRTDPREVLKRKVDRYHSRYNTYFGMDIRYDNGWLPYPIDLSGCEYVYNTGRTITEDDLVTEKDLNLLLECYAKLEEAERKIAEELKFYKKE